MNTILLIWIICGIFAAFSCYLTTYVILRVRDYNYMPFWLHTHAVTKLINEDYGRHGWLKMFFTSIALGPVALVVYNIIIYRILNGED